MKYQVSEHGGTVRKIPINKAQLSPRIGLKALLETFEAPSLSHHFLSSSLFHFIPHTLQNWISISPNPNQICSDQLNPLQNLPNPPWNSSAVTAAESSLVTLTASSATTEATPASSPSTALLPSPVSFHSLSPSLSQSHSHSIYFPFTNSLYFKTTISFAFHDK